MAKRLPKADLQNLPARAADFLKLVAKKMWYRRKIRTEVLAELAAHFEDELHDCKTDDDRDKKAQRLIAEFGDAKLLAVLLRRAKKRCRPLWRKVAARTFQAIGMLILCLIIYLAWFLSGRPSITTNYVALLNQMVKPTADESSNAAPLYIQAVKLYKKSFKSSDPNEESRKLSELLSKKYSEVTIDQKKSIEKWLTENNQILDLVTAGADKPYYWQTYHDSQNTGEMLGILPLPDLPEYRYLARVLRWQVLLNAENGRYEDAFANIKSCYRFGRHFKGDKTLVEQLVGIAIQAFSTQTLREILAGHKIDSVELAALQSDFEKMIAGENFLFSLKEERLLFEDELQRCFTKDRIGGGHLYLLGLIDSNLSGDGKLHTDRIARMRELGLILLTSQNVLFWHPNRQQTKEAADKCYAFAEEMFRKTPARLQAEGIDIEKECMKIIKGNLLLGILLPPTGTIHELSYRVKTDVEATLAIIAVLRYKQDVGSYPENLEKLVAAGYLKELPMDPYSDRPLVYKKTDDAFILYSVGENFKDDGGERGRDEKGSIKLWTDNGDAVFWPVEGI